MIQDPSKQIYKVGEFVRGGGFRDTYECASEPGKLLKFDRYIDGQRKVKSRGFVKDLFRSLRSKLGYKKQRLTGNQDELLGWLQIEERGLADHRFFAKVYGMVETDRGPALMTEKIDNFWNSEIRSISNYIREHGRIDQADLIKALLDYFKLLGTHNISSFADRPENMGIVVDENGNRYLKCFDVKPYMDHQIIPVHKIGFMHKRRVSRRLNRHLSALRGKTSRKDAGI
ncbi:YrbL family protein [Pseudovibrio sp. Tun.PSC04-5.I4]|uniref:YrbL family protein n=1 Tax=Pseudovibrio sp. Tun.PSC04-5.I4 TaxID=1798213 RepID=UPI00087F38C6|nr:YrbL family protein [Pseudovibrio sp. Tun.PSC04-5.I4]SDQ20006.1 PhoP regulatory network protein YrbL [Pseudovibrio sp. Tun.PSC04-5.I4]